MKIKQQEQIKDFLINEFGSNKGNDLFKKQDEILGVIIKNIKNKSKNQEKTLIETILPRIALYKAMPNCNISQEETKKHMRKYMLEIVAAKKHSSTAKMEKIPFFYTLYSKIFIKIMKTSDLWESTTNYEKNHFGADITKCLWHTACVENGCEELCPLFCDVDDVTYGGLKKMVFSRTKTLGYGGDCCDFRFYKK